MSISFFTYIIINVITEARDIHWFVFYAADFYNQQTYCLD